MERQKNFAQAEQTQKKKPPLRERFLIEIEQIVPWATPVACIEPHSFHAGRARNPAGIPPMLRALADETPDQHFPPS
jgi:transposase, IS5 family